MSRNNDLRPHSHTKTGDGGAIPGIPREVASDSRTVAANSTEAVYLGLDNDGHYLVTAYPETGYGGWYSHQSLANSGLAVELFWMNSGNSYSGNEGWHVTFDEVNGESHTVHWQVYEIQ